MVQNIEDAEGTFVNAMSPLFDGMTEFTEHERAVIKSRFIPMIDATEREASRAEWWDTRMFLLGFGSSLIVTIAAALNIAGYVSVSSKDIVGTMVLLVSSIGTAALGLRERLKFHEAAGIARRLSCKLQRRGFLFLARAEPYAHQDRHESFADFVRHTELMKVQADEERNKLQGDDSSYQNAAASNRQQWTSIATPQVGGQLPQSSPTPPASTAPASIADSS